MRKTEGQTGTTMRRAIALMLCVVLAVGGAPTTALAEAANEVGAAAAEEDAGTEGMGNEDAMGVEDDDPVTSGDDAVADVEVADEDVEAQMSDDVATVDGDDAAAAADEEVAVIDDETAEAEPSVTAPAAGDDATQGADPGEDVELTPLAAEADPEPQNAPATLSAEASANSRTLHIASSASTSFDLDIAGSAAMLCDCAQGSDGNRIHDVLMGTFGCTDPKVENYWGNETVGGSAAYSIAHATVKAGTKKTVVLFVVPRGSHTLWELIGDGAKGPKMSFLGQEVWNNVLDFEKTVWTGLNEYVNDHAKEIESASKLKILVCGHSLGGACANMVAARLTRGIGKKTAWWGSRVKKADILCYTFGAINVLTSKAGSIRKGYENIHNVYNYYDSFGPHGNWRLGTATSTPDSKWGHAEVFKHDYGETALDSCVNHDMANYRDALSAGYVTRNPIEAKAKKAKQSVAWSGTKARTLAANVKVTSARGKVAYANASKNATAKKFKVNKITGRVTVPKGIKSGTYVVRIKATAAGDSCRKKGSKTVSFKVTVKPKPQVIRGSGWSFTVPEYWRGKVSIERSSWTSSSGRKWKSFDFVCKNAKTQAGYGISVLRITQVTGDNPKYGVGVYNRSGYSDGSAKLGSGQTVQYYGEEMGEELYVPVSTRVGLSVYTGNPGMLLNYYTTQEEGERAERSMGRYADLQTFGAIKTRDVYESSGEEPIVTCLKTVAKKIRVKRTLCSRYLEQLEKLPAVYARYTFADVYGDSKNEMICASFNDGYTGMSNGTLYVFTYKGGKVVQLCKEDFSGIYWSIDFYKQTSSFVRHSGNGGISADIYYTISKGSYQWVSTRNKYWGGSGYQYAYTVGNKSVSKASFDKKVNPLLKGKKTSTSLESWHKYGLE